jgi:allophanate hydrolase
MDLRISTLLNAYRHGTTTPRAVIKRILDEMDKAPSQIWISRLSRESLEKYLEPLEKCNSIPANKPLFGIPFAIKDNIDFEGLESTSACPAYAYKPQKSSFVVSRLIAAGAIPLGKTNMDQFATGLVGVRSPYGSIPNKFAPEYISGGSSSGSAAALAYGLCSFSLGTDTAGSGRVPAAFNKLVGVKPTRGLLSTSGVIPACRSLDCVSIFALDTDDAQTVLNIAQGEDSEDAYSRKAPWIQAETDCARLPEKWTFGVPDKLEFFGNEGYRKAFDKTVQAFENAGGTKVIIPFEPFLKAAKLLYEGPWVFERYNAVGKFIEEHSDEIHPVTKSIITPKRTPHPAEVFEGFHTLQAYKKIADKIISSVDFLLTPTAGTIYKTADVEKNPIELNSNLGYYTNYMNLLDYSALAIPSEDAVCESEDVTSLPFGVTLVGKAFDDYKLLDAAKKVEPYLASKIPLAVCGAHLKGCALHEELSRAVFLEATETAPEYKMLALSGPIPKPALIAAPDGEGHSFYIEIYALSAEDFGEFVKRVPAPLSIGKVKTIDGRFVSGFVADSSVLELYRAGKATDISEFEDWRKYRSSL